MLAQITLPAKWSYAPGPIRIVSYAFGSQINANFYIIA